MRKILQTTALTFTFSLCASEALPENLTYDQNAAATGAGLKTEPAWIGGLPNSLHPGTAAAPSASGNTVVIDYGAGVTVNTAYGGLSEADTASGNTVFIRNGVVATHAAGGASSSGMATDNTVYFSGGVINRLFGGMSITGAATNNTVYFSGGRADQIAGGYSNDNAANDNSVYVSGGEADTVAGGASLADATNNNTVTITGGTVRATVYGGWGTTAAINNTVNISGSPNLQSAAIIGGEGAVSQGNTLNILGFTGPVGGVGSFQNINFVLPASMQNGGTVLTGTPLGAIITDAKIGVNIEGGGTPLAPGSRITLINSNSGVTGSPANTSGTAMKGITILYDYHLSQDADNLYVDLGSVYINPQTKSLIDGNLARFIGPLNGADLLVGKGINSALSAAESCEFRKHSSNAAENQPAPVNSTLNADSGWSVFVVSLGGASRYGTGSHIDVTGLSMLTGVAKRFDSGKSDKLLAGVFFEAGWGDYDAHNSFSRMSSVNGDGTTSYYGGGILGRYDLDFGLYFDASARMGAVLGNYNSKDLHDGLGKRAEYDMTTLYYGLHLGAGYLWNISDCARLDVSSKFIWTHQSPDHATIANDRVKFEAIDSLRWRSGARLSYGATSSFAPYVGVYYDHEFDGQAKGSVYAFGIPSTALEGGTGVGEIGVAFNPTGTDTFSVDLGVQGYTGVREGVTGSVQLKWDF